MKTLELFLDGGVPETAFGVRSTFVVPVLKRGSHEWRLLVEHVVDTEGEGGLVKPSSPAARIVFGRGNRHHVLILPAHLHIFAAILGISGNFGLCRWRWQIECVVEDQVERNPFAHFAGAAKRGRGAAISRMSLGIESLVIPVLANVVNDETSIDALHPGAVRAVIEQTGVPAVVSERTATVYTLETATEFADRRETFSVHNSLDINVSHIGFIPGCSKCSPIAVAESAGFEDLHYFEVPGAQDFATKVLERGSQVDDWTKRRAKSGSKRRTALDLTGK